MWYRFHSTVDVKALHRESNVSFSGAPLPMNADSSYWNETDCRLTVEIFYSSCSVFWRVSHTRAFGHFLSSLSHLNDSWRPPCVIPSPFNLLVAAATCFLTLCMVFFWQE
jgi:hypothetical protein